MKSYEDIFACKRLLVGEDSKRMVLNGMADGFAGYFENSRFKGSVICSTGAGWEHVSVSPAKRNYIPTWDDMCQLKDIFFRDDEAVIQIHPPKDQYVNNMSNCLHLWRCTYKPMVLPPSVLVGIREGQTRAEIEEEIREAYAIAGEEYR